MDTRFESTHLPDLIDEDVDAPMHVRRLAAHYGDLVRFASQVEPGESKQTPIPCRRRPGRRPCGGFLVAELQKSTKDVEWHCPSCGTGGVIAGWQGTQADLRAMRKRQRKDAREVAITAEAFAALRDLARNDRELGRLAFTAQIRGGRTVLFVSGDESARYRARLAREALVASGNRAAGLLLTIVDCLGGSKATEDGADGLVEMNPADVPGILDMLLRLPDSRPPEFVFTDAGGRQRRIKPLRRPPKQTFQIKVTLRDVRPPIWRRLQVPSDILLPKPDGWSRRWVDAGGQRGDRRAGGVGWSEPLLQVPMPVEYPM